MACGKEAQVLNPELYRRLRAAFGDVRVVSEGAAIQWKVATKYQDGRLLKTREIVSPGEEYVVCCPFCGDRRQRLYINHRWATKDPVLGDVLRWCFNCFNEQCHLVPDNAERLFLRVFSQQRWKDAPAVKIREGEAAPKAEQVLWPGRVVRLNALEDGHPAREYLRSRGFDPDVLCKTYRVGYCTASRFPLAQGRLIFPIVVRRKLVGWQARYPADRLPDGTSLKEAGIIKYFSCPGQVKRMIAFNYDKAIRHPVIAIVEGPLDVCGTGPYALGVLGKTVSRSFQEQLISDVRRLWQTRAAIAVILDPDQDVDARRRGKPHHINIAVRELRQLYPNVFPVFLPAGTDPGSYPAEKTRYLIEVAAANADVTLDWEAKPNDSGSYETKGCGARRLRTTKSDTGV